MTATPVLAQTPDAPSESGSQRGTVESLTSVLPSAVGGMTRETLTSTTLAPPSGPMPDPSVRPFLLFLPELLMEVADAPDSLQVVRARYEGGPRPLFAGIVDYGSLPDELRSGYLSATAEGHAEKKTHRVDGHNLLLLRGNGSSDDVIMPNGVRALIAGRFEVVVFEQPPKGVNSVTQFDELPEKKIDEMVARAEEFLLELELQKLATRTEETR